MNSRGRRHDTPPSGNTDMGLRGTADDLESLRKRLDAVAPGFLQAQDKMAAFQDRLNAAMAYKKK